MRQVAAEILKKWLRSGCLQSQYQAYVDSLASMKDSWYNRTMNEKGPEAARAELAQLRRSEFAASIESVARGMLAMAQADPEGKTTQVLILGEKSQFPRHWSLDQSAPTVVVFNRQAPGCGCNAPEGSDVWSLHGRMWLKAVTLQAGRLYNGGSVAKLGLVLPQRVNTDDKAWKEGFTVATIDLEGSVNAERLSPNGFPRDGYLMYELGLTSLEDALYCLKSSGGHFDDAMGFPGARDYLANALPALASYFTALAASLNHDHNH